MTLSAKFICDDPIGVRLLSTLPYADIVFGYEEVQFRLFMSFMNFEYFRKQKFWQKLILVFK